MTVGHTSLKYAGIKIICTALITCSLVACEKRIPQRFSLIEASRSYHLGDHERAFRIAEAVAFEGNPKAQYAVGYLYFYGIGTPQNEALGIAFFEQSAKSGNEKAQIALQTLFPDPIYTEETHIIESYEQPIPNNNVNTLGFPVSKNSDIVPVTNQTESNLGLQILSGNHVFNAAIQDKRTAPPSAVEVETEASTKVGSVTVMDRN